MECLKYGLYVFLKRNMETSPANSHNVTCKPIAAAENPSQGEFNCSATAITI